MNKWISEALRAPLDAWGLLLGLASACSILALLKYEFAKEPLRVILNNWRYWSHEFWGWLLSAVGIQLPKDIAVAITMLILCAAVLFRGLARNQTVESAPPTTMNDTLWFVGLLVGLLATFVFGIITNIDPASGTSDWSPAIVTLLAFAASIFLWLALLSTPRSFFGVVIAAIALLLIDRIPMQ